MSIRRGPRPDTRFYTVNKDLSEDKGLSWAARGMLIFLLGKPDNWEVSVSHLIKQTEGSSKPSGRDAVRGIIKELVEAGYMKADVRREEGGTFNGMDYVVHEVPTKEDSQPQTDYPSTDDAPKTDNPLTGEPSTDEPPAANPPQTKNEYQQGMKEEPKNESEQSTEADKSASGAQEVGSDVVLSEEQQANQSETIFQSKCRLTWLMYKAAYEQRYGIAPVRNAKVNSQVKSLVQRLGEEAGLVAEFYVYNVGESFVLKKTHDLGVLLSGAESYRTQWATGRAMTNTRAQQMDSTQANASAADEAIAMLRARQQGAHP